MKMLSEIIESRFYEEDYNEITMPLLYEKISYNDVIENGIAKIAKQTLFLYRGINDPMQELHEEEEAEEEVIVPIM